jgi:hypothetical protein
MKLSIRNVPLSILTLAHATVGIVPIFIWLNGWVYEGNVMVVNYSWERYVVVRRDYCAGTAIVFILHSL